MSTHTATHQERDARKASVLETGESEKRTGGIKEFVDNRPEILVQRKEQEMISASPRVSQQKSFQQVANNSPQVQSHSQYQEMASQFMGDRQGGQTSSADAPAQLRRDPANVDVLAAGKYMGSTDKVFTSAEDYVLSREPNPDPAKLQDLQERFRMRIEGLYQDLKTKGQKRWDRLMEVSQEHGWDTVGFADARIEKRRRDAEKFAEYKTKGKGHDPKYGHQIKSKYIGEEEWPDEGRDHDNAGHDNYIEFGEDGTTVVADDNARGAKAPLQNSEVFWQQIGQVAKDTADEDEDANIRAASAQTSLTRIVRTSISNDFTNAMIYTCLSGQVGADKTVAAQTFASGSDEFLVLLGTDNGSAAVGILIDHIDQMDKKTIGNIKASLEEVGGVMEINFV